MSLFDIIAGLAGGAGQGYLAADQVARENKDRAEVERQRAAQTIKDRLAAAQADMQQRTEMENLVSKVAGNAAVSATKRSVPQGAAEQPLPSDQAGPVMPPTGTAYDVSDASLSGLPADRRGPAKAQAVNIRRSSDEASASKDELNQSLIDQRTQSGQIALLKEQLAAAESPYQIQRLESMIALAGAQTAKAERAGTGPQKPVAWTDVELDPNRPGVKTHVGLDAEGKIVAYPHRGDSAPPGSTASDMPGALNKGLNATAQNRLSQAAKVFDQAKAVSARLDNPALTDQVGGINGLITAAKSKVGFDTPDFSGFQGDEASLEATLPFLHQFRGGKAVVDHFKAVIGDPMVSIANKKAAYRSLMDFAQRAARGEIGLLPDGMLGGAEAQPSGTRDVGSAEEAMRLPAGTRFKLPDGRTGTVRP